MAAAPGWPASEYGFYVIYALDGPRAQGRPGAFLSVVGGDFLEGRIERVQEAYERGIRSIQLTHYRINELGDIQTEAPRHGGLTPFGKDVNNYSEWPSITAALLAHGYSREDVGKIAGGNFLRVYRDVAAA